MSRQPFFHWARKEYLDSHNPYGDFTRDMSMDADFPWFHAFTKNSLDRYHDEVISHLHLSNACAQAIDTFEEMFKVYLSSMEHSYNSRKEYYKTWRANNKDKIATYNRKYWERKEQLLKQIITFTTSINDLGFSTRTQNCLNRDGRFITVEQLLDGYWTEQLITVRNLGRKGVKEIDDKLSELNFIH